MQSKLETLIEQAKIPGISIATASPGGKIATHTAGVINNNTPQQPVTETTIFEAASLSKPVFAYIVLKMAERGELDLDIPLYDQIGDFGPPEKKIRNHDNYKKLTAGMILSHQAGLPNEFERSKPETFDFVTEVGKQFNYSGEAYCFLQEVVEKIANSKSTGQLITLEDLAQKEFKNLDMINSSFLPLKDRIQATGHHPDGKIDTNQHFYGIHPAASLHTTAEDYCKFLTACATDSFIREKMFAPAVPEFSQKDTKAIDAKVPVTVLKQINWGLGIGLQNNKDGSFTAFHWGDNQTCRNFTAINLSTNQSIVCLTNSANGPAIFQQIAEPIVGDLNATCQWLYSREGFKFDVDVKSNPAANYRAAVTEIKLSDPDTTEQISEKMTKYNPLKTTPNPDNQ